MKKLILCLALLGCNAETETAELQFPTEYRNLGTGVLIPVTGTIPVGLNNACAVDVPIDATEVLITAQAPGFDLKESDLHVEQDLLGNVAAFYDPRGAGWIPLQPNVKRIVVSNDMTEGEAFFIYFSVTFR